MRFTARTDCSLAHGPRTAMRNSRGYAEKADRVKVEPETLVVAPRATVELPPDREPSTGGAPDVATTLLDELAELWPAGVGDRPASARLLIARRGERRSALGLRGHPVSSAGGRARSRAVRRARQADRAEKALDRGSPPTSPTPPAATAPRGSQCLSKPARADAPLRNLLLCLYSSARPRAFSSLAPDVLGRVYERSLAKRIVARPARESSRAFYRARRTAFSTHRATLSIMS